MAEAVASNKGVRRAQDYGGGKHSGLGVLGLTKIVVVILIDVDADQEDFSEEGWREKMTAVWEVGRSRVAL